MICEAFIKGQSFQHNVCFHTQSVETSSISIVLFSPSWTGMWCVANKCSSDLLFLGFLTRLSNFSFPIWHLFLCVCCQAYNTAQGTQGITVKNVVFSIWCFHIPFKLMELFTALDTKKKKKKKSSDYASPPPSSRLLVQAFQVKVILIISAVCNIW